ncbi:MAG: metallophosphoesterase [Geminicoccales bacterium]
MVDGRPASIPPGICVYAIGDIHGRADLMIEMHRMIMEDCQDLTPGTEKVLVYVGDFVDRGLESSQVLDLLIEEPLPDFGAVYLVGNHDAWFLSFLVDPKIGPSWLRYGGDATLHSYGVRVGMARDDMQYFKRLQRELAERVPAEHLSFLRGLEITFQIGDYLFVHAGIRPHIPIGEQSPDDLLWIREPFLSCNDDLGVVVVHGHTVEAEPTLRNNRIGIDTGACWTGNLTCVVLEEDSIRFLTTGGQPMPQR